MYVINLLYIEVSRNSYRIIRIWFFSSSWMSPPMSYESHTGFKLLNKQNTHEI